MIWTNYDAGDRMHRADTYAQRDGDMVRERSVEYVWDKVE
jgi:hypothetical protein